MPSFILSAAPYVQDPKNNWTAPLEIHIFARFSVVSLSIHPRSRRGAERIDQQQRQQSVASAILATTQQSVRNTNTLIITPIFTSESIYTWDSCGIVIVCGPERWIVDRGQTYTERLFGRATKKTDKTLILVLRYLEATTPFAVFIYYFVLVSGLSCCVLIPGIR